MFLALLVSGIVYAEDETDLAKEYQGWIEKVMRIQRAYNFAPSQTDLVSKPMRIRPKPGPVTLEAPQPFVPLLQGIPLDSLPVTLEAPQPFVPLPQGIPSDSLPVTLEAPQPSVPLPQGIPSDSLPVTVEAPQPSVPLPQGIPSDSLAPGPVTVPAPLNPTYSPGIIQDNNVEAIQKKDNETKLSAQTNGACFVHEMAETKSEKLPSKKQ